MTRPDVIIENKDLLTYVDYLEAIVKGRSRLEREIALFEDACADDMKIIRQGEAKDDESNLKYLRSDKRGEKTMGIIKLFKEVMPKGVKEPVRGEEPVKKAKKNIQDFALQ